MIPISAQTKSKTLFKILYIIQKCIKHAKGHLFRNDLKCTIKTLFTYVKRLFFPLFGYPLRHTHILYIALVKQIIFRLTKELTILFL